ncbi:hypothetical protein [Planctomicrobium sp. SH527]|uniref:hypothetical protein n=1 Tax=Planctomicrobium sp. SH527 TaxID=3448123 RepID=UPI003F5B2648
MTSKQIALLVGGLLPAVGLGIGAFFQKMSGHHGIATGPFLIVGGLVISAVGGFFIAFERDATITPKAVGYTVLFAISWAVSSGLISLALRKLGANLSQIVPIYNMNTLVAVLASMMLLAEWRTVSPPKIIAASLLIIAGGILASRS